MKRFVVAAADMVVGWVDALLKWVGQRWLPVHLWLREQPADALIYFVGTVALLGLAVLMQLGYWRRLERDPKLARAKEQAFQRRLELPFLASFFYTVMRVFYPFILMWFGLQFYYWAPGLPERTRELKVLTFTNFATSGAWDQMTKIITVATLLWFFASSLACVVRLRLLELLRFWVQSLAFAWLGHLVYSVLSAMTGMGWLMNLLADLVGGFLVLGLEFAFSVVAVIPFLMVLFFFLMPVLDFLGRHFDLGPSAGTARDPQAVARYSDGSEKEIVDAEGHIVDYELYIEMGKNLSLWDVLFLPW